MYNLKLNNSIELSYEDGKVLLNGKETQDYQAVFMESGKVDELYGYVNVKTKECHSLNGWNSNITDIDEIKFN